MTRDMSEPDGSAGGCAPSPSGDGWTPPARLTDEALETLANDVARRCAPVFAAAGWTYANWSGDRWVPTETHLAETVARLLDNAGANVFSDDGGSSSSGRFWVSRWIDEDENAEFCSIQLEVGFSDSPEPEAAGHPRASASASTKGQDPSPRTGLGDG